MSVFGVDLGNLYSTVSVARRRGIDIIMNEVSKRETSTYVSLGNGEEGRMIGEKGADMMIRNFRNTVNHLKRLVGVKFDSPTWEEERAYCMFKAIPGDDGYVAVEVTVDGEPAVFRPEQLIAMMLGKLRSYADREAATEAGIKGTAAVRVVDCVVSCPPYYSAFQRKLLLQATEIAGLNCLTLVTEGTAIALSYGIFKSEDLPEKEEDGIIVQFCDVGHSATYITTVKFWQGNLKVLSHVYDKHLGCRDFDLALADHFRKEIQAKYKIDVYEQKKAKIRLLAGCEKIRQTLSGIKQVSLNVECIMDDIDVSFPKYTRDEFDDLCAGLWDKMEKLVDRAAAAVPEGASVKAVELVGGGSYMPKVKGILEHAFKMHVSTTLNASEAVAKGCGIVGAILSPRFHVKSFQVQDALVDAIKIGYLSTASSDPSPVSFISDINKETVLYEKNASFPKVFDLSFDRQGAFDLYTYYGEPCPNVANDNGSLLLGHWTLSDLPVAKNLQGEPEPEKPVRVAVRFRLNSSGVVTVDSAAVTEQYEVQEEVEKKVEKKEGEEDKKEETEKVMVTKKKSRKIEVVVTPKFIHGLTSGQVEDMAKMEIKMANADRLLTETIDAKNALEGYSYEYRDKVLEGGPLYPYMDEKQREAFKQACSDVTDWVYAEGENSTKEEYVKRLTELRKPGDEAVARMKVREEVPFTFKEAEANVLKQMDEANRLLGGETHIEKAKLEEIVKRGQEALDFFKAEKQGLEATPLFVTPSVTVAQIMGKSNDVANFARPIFATPKPAPPKDEKKEEKPADKDAASPKADQPASPSAGMDVD
eukprot:TRINITY_DN443_c0_g1_i1.p1 TRINITY_DN443_c0_g1~~TRINITY_DN443_c0_g1_i1.p1  ORF type:complete len:815 (+),score=372.49 TRINITY_DN443_c0_g1_i1:125-2569(+)